jgi:predicted metal-dependent HD superfamily phosphohydrolase
MLDDVLVDECKEYVINLISKLSANYSYHDVNHTLQVFEVVGELAKAEGVNDQEMKYLQVAALFHDVGYVRDALNHETAGAWMLGEHLKYQLKPSEIVIIEHLILATSPGAVPMNHLEQIIKDADISYLGTTEFEIISEKLRSEWEKTRQLTFKDEDWMKMNLRFLKESTYYTGEAQKRYNEGKDVNQRLIEAKLVG